METILFKIEHNVARITLNRPEVFNSFNRDMALLLQEKLKECHQNEEIRAVYLTGAGKAFCAGQDLNEVVSEDGIPISKIIDEHFNPIIRSIRELMKPVVCGVNGIAAGAGANLAIACDITIASDAASFVQAFSKIGLIPDTGGTYFLPRLVGQQRAAALMMLGEKLGAKEAESIGLIYKCHPRKKFEAEALKLTKTLAQMPTVALGLTKKALNYSLEYDLSKQLAIEDQLQTEASQTEDFQEGVAAFLEKRQAVV